MAWIDTATAARLVGTTVRIAMFATLEFRSATRRVWGGSHRVVVGGYLWEPIGELGSITGIDAPRGPTSEPVTMELSGVSPEIIAIAVAEADEVAGRSAAVHAQLFDDAWQAVGPMLPLWHGVMSRMRVRRTEGDEPQRVIAVECEGVWEARARQAAGRFNDGDQQWRYPGDRFFRFVSNQAGRPSVWPDY